MGPDPFAPAHVATVRRSTCCTGDATASGMRATPATRSTGAGRIDKVELVCGLLQRRSVTGWYGDAWPRAATVTRTMGCDDKAKPWHELHRRRTRTRWSQTSAAAAHEHDCQLVRMDNDMEREGPFVSSCKWIRTKEGETKDK